MHCIMDSTPPHGYVSFVSKEDGKEAADKLSYFNSGEPACTSQLGSVADGDVK